MENRTLAVGWYLTHQTKQAFCIMPNFSIFFQPFLIQGDLSREEDTQNVLDKTIEHYGKLDVLVSRNHWLLHAIVWRLAVV